MYYVGKIFQAAGITIILIDFLREFPGLMSRQILGLGIAMFIAGWAIQRFILKG